MPIVDKPFMILDSLNCKLVWFFMSLRCMFVSIWMSNVFNETVDPLLVIKFILFHVLIIFSIFIMLMIFLEDVSLFWISWADALWRRCWCVRNLDAFVSVFCNSFCESKYFFDVSYCYPSGVDDMRYIVLQFLHLFLLVDSSLVLS